MNYPLIRKLSEEWLLITVIIGLILTSIYLKRFPSYSLNDFRIIYILFVFLIIVKGMEKNGFTDYIASIFMGKYLPYKLIILTAILSMFLTNDVALITVVPITLSMNIENKAFLIIIETITANGLSALTPFGNPQNILIYYFFHLHPVTFIYAIAPLTIVSLIFVFILASLYKSKAILHVEREKFNKRTYVYIASFILFVSAILRILPLEIGIIPIIFVIVFDRKSLSIDYFLLFIFIAFFGFTDNLSHILKFVFKNSMEVFLYSCLTSQLMSNVPATLFFIDFTNNWKALLWGVSVGGFGNVVGSLASLISYRFYKASFSDYKSYLIKFHIISYLAFFIGVLTFFVCNL